MEENKKFKRIVVKLGTNVLVSKGNLDDLIYANIADQVAKLSLQGIEVIIVSSGSIKAGEECLQGFKMDIDGYPEEILSVAGIPNWTSKWSAAFSRRGIPMAPILVTYGSWKNKYERANIKNRIPICLGFGIIPVINENDFVSDKEIKLMTKGISENDRLARMVAKLAGADGVLFLTRVGGIRKNYLQNSKEEFYDVINVDKLPLELHIAQNVSGDGRGGMNAKLKAGIYCARRGMYTVIGGLQEEDAILKFARKEKIGTLLTSDVPKSIFKKFILKFF
ncbi:MAG: hypothetical protein ABIC82_00445 [bacterium]